MDLDILRRPFLQVPLKNIAEIYNDQILPRMTKKNKVVAISTAIILMITYKLNKLLRPPRHLAHIPYQSYFSLISSLLTKKTFLERSQHFGLPLINSKESNGLYLVTMMLPFYIYL
jgi:hypothetical protein